MWPLPLPYTGRLIVRLNQDGVSRLVLHLANTGTFPDSLQAIGSVIGPNATEFVQLLDQPGFQVFPAVPPSLASTVKQNYDQAPPLPGGERYPLLSYFIIDPVPTPRMPINVLVQQLAELTLVDLVQREPSLLEAGAWAVDPDDYNAADDTLDAGIHAKGYDDEYGTYGLNCWTDAVWQRYSGQGVGFMDLEAAWHLGHADLPVAAKAQPLHGFNCTRDRSARSHGTMSLGVVLGIDDSKGIVGIAPQATFQGVVSRATIDTNNVLGDPDAKSCADITGAVVTAVENLNVGDVLLIEVETRTVMYSHLDGTPVPDHAPIEIVDLWFDAIRYATANGIVVIEPAGNGGENLDAPGWTWPMNGRTLDRANGGAAFRDSGAIMVSACDATVAVVGSEYVHGEDTAFNYGSRIDCYGWSASIGTTDVDFNGADIYYANYRATSAASAMIAGAALLVQQMCIAVNGTPASPATIRQLLSDRSTGTRVADTGKVVPDLSMIAARVGALADVFVRDHVGDDGTVPSLTVSASPDIIIRNVQEPDPQGAFGHGSGVEDDLLPNDPIVPDQPNYVYVRVRNRSTVDADAVRATVYWADTMTAVPPSEWNEIATTAAAAVPGSAGPGLLGPVTVLPEIVWTPASGAVPPQYPGTHGCLVAVVDAVDDPRPPVFPSLGDMVTGWSAFLNVIGANNNIAFRNFEVLMLTPAQAGAGFEAASEFIMPGAPMPAAFDFIVAAEPCADVRWEIYIPEALRAAVPESYHPERDSRREKYIRIPVPAGDDLHFRGVRLAARARHRCRVRAAATTKPERPCRLVVRQLYRGMEIGRVTLAIGGRRMRDMTTT